MQKGVLNVGEAAGGGLLQIPRGGWSNVKALLKCIRFRWWPSCVFGIPRGTGKRQLAQALRSNREVPQFSQPIQRDERRASWSVGKLAEGVAPGLLRAVTVVRRIDYSAGARRILIDANGPKGDDDKPLQNFEGQPGWIVPAVEW